MKFSPAEDTAMWNWCIEHELNGSLTQFWEDFRVATGSPRNAASLRKRFTKKLLPHLHTTSYSDEVKLMLYKKMQTPINAEFIGSVHGYWIVDLDEHGRVMSFSPRAYILNDSPRGQGAVEALPALIPQSQVMTSLNRSLLEMSGPLVPVERHVRFTEEAVVHEANYHDFEYNEENEENQQQIDLKREHSVPIEYPPVVHIKREPRDFEEEEGPEENVDILSEHQRQDSRSMEQFIQEHMVHENGAQEIIEQQNIHIQDPPENIIQESIEQNPTRGQSLDLVPIDDENGNAPNGLNLVPFLDSIHETVASVVANTIKSHLESLHIKETIEKAVSQEIAKKSKTMVDPKPFLLVMKKLVENLEDSQGMEEIGHAINAAIAKLACSETKVREDQLELAMEMILSVIGA